jgi:hypothetical protein
MPSQAEMLFESIFAANDPGAIIRSWSHASPPTFEEEWLDFKVGTAGPPASPRPLEEKFIKETWSKTLSGFGNTGGGVLVWGVDCRKMPSPIDSTNEIDAAGDLRPVPDPLALKSRLLELLLGATDPGVGGVQVREIIAPGGGFVVCHVPEGRAKPYRADLVAGKPYYQRVGQSFEIIPTSLLRSLFYPHASARLAIMVDYQFNKDPSNPMTTYETSVENRGTASAHDVVVHYEIESAWNHFRTPAHFERGRGWEPIKVYPAKGSLVCERPIHPEESRQLYVQTFPMLEGFSESKRVILRFKLFSRDAARMTCQFMHSPFSLDLKSMGSNEAAEVPDWYRDNIAGFTR